MLSTRDLVALAFVTISIVELVLSRFPKREYHIYCDTESFQKLYPNTEKRLYKVNLTEYEKGI